MKALLFLIAILNLNSAFARGGHDDEFEAADYYEHRCSMCHGENGFSVLDIAPNLAGQKQIYVVQQLKDFRDNKRSGVYMPSMAANLTDEQITALASYLEKMNTCRR